VRPEARSEFVRAVLAEEERREGSTDTEVSGTYRDLVHPSASRTASTDRGRRRVAGGDVDLAAVGALLADPGRCRILLALGDGRALPASQLAAEAGVTAATASSHLHKLAAAGLLAVEPHGRFRYYRLAGPDVGRLIEAVGSFAPAVPVRSLRSSMRAAALRDARTCYDHLAGRLGVALMSTFLRRGYISGGDGTLSVDGTGGDRLSAPGHDVDYALTPSGFRFLDEFGAVLPPRRRALGYCVDWTEQRHHLAGGAGRALLDRLLALDWIRRGATSRAIVVTEAGRRQFPEQLDVPLPPAVSRCAS
jgi:DNA-binding transcriptional ArsR family regulator